MKRLVSKYEREKRARRNQIIVGVVLVFVMLLSVLGYAIQAGPGKENNKENSAEKVVYNGIEFLFVNGFWVAGGFAFSYNPSEIQEFLIEAPEDLKNATMYQGKPLYIYSENAGAEDELRANMKLITDQVEEVCVKGLNCSKNLSVKKCDGEGNIIVVKESSNRSIMQNKNCVFIEGQSNELLAMSDSFLFKTLGVT